MPLNPSQKVVGSVTGNQYVVDRQLGVGGQGFVYKTDCNNESYAVKWYNSTFSNPAQKTAISTLVQIGRPSETFLWPTELVSCAGDNDFGYVMPLRPQNFAQFSDLLNGVNMSFRAKATAALKLARSFHALHARGYCYCDISLANIFVAIESGDIRICDVDNVIVQGQTPLILGTPYFMAPEVVTGKAHPDAKTDRFSLAVIFFYLFYMGHPLSDGALGDVPFTPEAQKKLFGDNPLFVLDKNDPSNRPIPGVHDSILFFYDAYPDRFNDFFAEAFSQERLSNPGRRKLESEWSRFLSNFRDSIYVCSCGAECFYDGPNGKPCWNCGAKNDPIRIELGAVALDGRFLVQRVVTLSQGTELFKHHFCDNFDFEHCEAVVVAHPKRPDVLGLCNKTNYPWDVTLPRGERCNVQPGQATPIARGTRFNFGSCYGKIR